MPADRPAAGAGVAGLAALGLAACCGLPVLLSIGAGVTIAGVGVRSWLLILAGVVIVVSGALVWRRHRRTNCAPARGGRSER